MYEPLGMNRASATSSTRAGGTLWKSLSNFAFQVEQLIIGSSVELYIFLHVRIYKPKFKPVSWQSSTWGKQKIYRDKFGCCFICWVVMFNLSSEMWIIVVFFFVWGGGGGKELADFQKKKLLHSKSREKFMNSKSRMKLKNFKVKNFSHKKRNNSKIANTLRPLPTKNGLSKILPLKRN